MKNTVNVGYASGSCSTNTCHANGSWTDPTPVLADLGCTDCHSGTYIGGDVAGPNNNLPVTGLHATASGTMLSANPHTDGFDTNVDTAGVQAGTCATRHTTQPTVVEADHINGTFSATPGVGGNTVINFATAVGFADAVTLTGSVDHLDVGRYLARMDVGVASYPVMSEFYFSPLKVWEYAAASVPIAASASGELPALFPHKEAALLHPPGNARKLVQC